MPIDTAQRLGRAIRSIVFAAAALLATLAVASPAVAARRWDALATTLLQPVAQEEQLPNSAIPMAMATDRQGFLWVGTQNGLARWDGLRFRIYTAGDKPGALPDSQIDTLHADREGRLWIGTPSGGLARFDPRTDRFTTYTAGPSGLSHVGVHALADAPDGGLWVGTEAGLDEFAASGRIRHVAASGPQKAAVADALASGVVSLATGGHNLWIGTHKGLLRLDDRTGAIAAAHLDPKEPAIYALVVGSDGRVWAGSDGRGAYVVDPVSLKAIAVAGSRVNGVKALGTRVRAIVEISPDEIWLGAYDDGIIAIDPHTLAGHKVRAGNGNLLYADQNIRAMHRAPNGLVFIAANSAITRYDPRRVAFATLMGGQAPTAALSERTPVTVFEAADRRLWVGSMSHGIDRIDPHNGRIDHLLPGPGGLPKAAVRSYATLKDGKVLVATDLGLFRLDADGRNPSRVAQPGREPDARVQSLLRDGDRLWLGGRDGLWAYRLGPGDTLVPDMVVPAGALTDRRIDVLSPGAHGDLWIGTDNGLNRYDAGAGRIEQLVPRPGDQTTPRGFISSVTTDSAGRLWVTTFGRGISVADPAPAGQPLRFRRIDVQDGLPNANVNKVIEDRHGALWASTDSGLTRIDPHTLRIDVYRSAEGVPVSSFFYNAGIRSSDGEILFPGRGGLLVVRPDLVKTLHIPPPLVVTEVRSRGHVLGGDPFLGLAAGRSLRVPGGANGLEVSFAALDYAAADQVRYSYRLVGSGDSIGAREPWIETDATRPLASFTNLTPGDYWLEIRAANPTGAWSARTLSLPITVLPAWYQTWWFRALEGLALLALVALVIRWRTGHLHRKRRELEAMVDERTHALRAQTVALERQAVELAQATARAEALAKAKSDFLANMSHEIRTPLNGVVAVADMLTRSDLAPKEHEMAEIIRASGDTLQRLLSDILDTARIESGKIAIEAAPFHAGAMLRAVAGLSQLKCDEKGARLVVEISPEIDQTVMGDLVRVRQVITNLLSNAVKFTDRGEIRLIAERTPLGLARFTVADTGVGFAMADKGKVLGRFEQADTSITRRYGGSGLGLSICCDLAGLMGGTLDCDSEPGVGSRFWLELPLDPATAVEPAAAPAESAVEALVDAQEQPLRILLADDHPTNRKVVQLMLEGGLAALTSVENGKEALEAFQDSAFDLILMDMQMPVMDGLTAIQEIRRLEQSEGRPRTPVIMLTANALPEHVAGALAAGADLHLSKPFTAPALFDTIGAALALRADAEMAA